MSDPRSAPEFWQAWKDFEVKHGNEDTLREMLRIKRSVQHTYNTQVNMMSAQMLSGAIQKSSTQEVIKQDEMKLLEEKAAAASADKENRPKDGLGRSNIMFVRGETQSKAVDEAMKGQSVSNPDEIDIDDEDEEDEEDTDNEDETQPGSFGGVEKQAIPAEVFGGLRKEDD